MPNFIFWADGEERKKFKKYIDPNNFNVMIQGKLQDWKDIAADMFLDLIGEDVNQPKSRHQVSKRNTIIFERNYNEQT
jgi:glucan phosphoethanolaminetransferase (alkaline phosphatase superfamily)